MKITKMIISSFSLLSIISCATDNKSTTTPTASVSPSTATKVAFKDVKAIIAKNCLSCHSNAGRSGGRAFEDDTDIVNNAARINTAAVVLGRMPLSGNKLSDSEKQTIKAWVEKEHQLINTKKSFFNP